MATPSRGRGYLAGFSRFQTPRQDVLRVAWVVPCTSAISSFAGLEQRFTIRLTTSSRSAYVAGLLN